MAFIDIGILTIDFDRKIVVAANGSDVEVKFVKDGTTDSTFTATGMSIDTARTIIYEQQEAEFKRMAMGFPQVSSCGAGCGGGCG